MKAADKISLFGSPTFIANSILERVTKKSMVAVGFSFGFQWGLAGVFIVNFEQISFITLVFPLLTMKKYMTAG